MADALEGRSIISQDMAFIIERLLVEIAKVLNAKEPDMVGLREAFDAYKAQVVRDIQWPAP